MASAELKVGQKVRNPENGYLWEITSIDRGWVRLTDSLGHSHPRLASEVVRLFEVLEC